MIRQQAADRGAQLPVVLTGATGGIGRALAFALAAEGYALILACRSEKKYAALAAELSAAYPGAHSEFLSLDLTSAQSVGAAADALAGRELAGVIHNAGTMERHLTVMPSGRERTLEVNYFNTKLLAERTASLVTRGGAIVFTTSITRLLYLRASERPRPRHFSQLGTYAYSKALLTRYAADLAARMEPRGVRVNCADPGVVDSGMISMDRWYDPLADRIFRPLIRTPRQGAEPALRAFQSPLSGRIFCRRAVHKLPSKTNIK